MVLRSSGIGAMVVTVAVVGMMVPHVHSFTTPSALPGAHTHGRHSLLSTMRSSRSVAVQRSLHSVHMSVALDNFESGGADPVDSIQSLDSLVSRKEVTKLIKQTSDLEGAKQVIAGHLVIELKKRSCAPVDVCDGGVFSVHYVGLFAGLAAVCLCAGRFFRPCPSTPSGCGAGKCVS